MVEKYRHMDIYSDVHPFKETMIWMKNKLGKRVSSEETYINANRIQSVYHEGNDEAHMIATQGPMDHTQHHFWKLVQ